MGHKQPKPKLAASTIQKITGLPLCAFQNRFTKMEVKNDLTSIYIVQDYSVVSRGCLFQGVPIQRKRK